MTPEEELILNEEASVPLIEKVKELPSASLAVTVPTEVWFSAALKDEAEVKVGGVPVSSTSLILTVTD